MFRLAPLFLFTATITSAAPPPAPSTLPAAESPAYWLRRAAAEAGEAGLYKMTTRQRSLISNIATAQVRLPDQEGLKTTVAMMATWASSGNDLSGRILNHGCVAYYALRSGDRGLYEVELEKAVRAQDELAKIMDKLGISEEPFQIYLDTVRAAAGDDKRAARAAHAATQPADSARMHVSMAIASLESGNRPLFQKHIQAAIAVARDDPASSEATFFSVANALQLAGDFEGAAHALFSIKDPFDDRGIFGAMLTQQCDHDPAGYQMSVTRACAAIEAMPSLAHKARCYALLIHGHIQRHDLQGLKRTLPPLVELSTIVADKYIPYSAIVSGYAALGDERAAQAAIEKLRDEGDMAFAAYDLACAGNLKLAQSLASRITDKRRISFVNMSFAITEARSSRMTTALDFYQRITDPEYKRAAAEAFATELSKRSDVPSLTKWINSLPTAADRARCSFSAAEGLHKNRFYEPADFGNFGYGLEYPEQ